MFLGIYSIIVLSIILLCYEQNTHLNTRKNYTQCINDDSTNINKAINTSLIFDTNVANGKNEYYYSNHQEISVI